MTNFRFMTDALNIFNALLENGINGCELHNTFSELRILIEDYEEMEGYEPDEPEIINRGDLELVNQLIANIHDEIFKLWELEKTDD